MKIYLGVQALLTFASFCEAQETCDDNLQNQNETGVDCGGICDPCDFVTHYDLYCPEKNELGEFMEDLDACKSRCLSEQTCVGFDFQENVCWLSTSCTLDELLEWPGCDYVERIF
eukprot:Awhi_evm1s15741